ncbi:hypothetical protein ABT392_07955 [Paucibacter sp. JuS9]|uniref:hypothetical protein n=1 Tax=Paucibacter sp. JuS9 TaxID=3228748 RepID=UPI003756F8C4
MRSRNVLGSFAIALNELALETGRQNEFLEGRRVAFSRASTGRFSGGFGTLCRRKLSAFRKRLLTRRTVVAQCMRDAFKHRDELGLKAMGSSAEIAKWIGDLDELLSVIQSEKQSAKPGGRRLHDYISRAQLNMQVLRVCISLDHSRGELAEAARSTNAELRQADLLSAHSRSSQHFRAALRLAVGLSGFIVSAFDQAPE